MNLIADWPNVQSSKHDLKIEISDIMYSPIFVFQPVWNSLEDLWYTNLCVSKDTMNFIPNSAVQLVLNFFIRKYKY